MWTQSAVMSRRPSRAAFAASTWSGARYAKGFVGYYTNWRGAPRIVIRGDKTPMDVLSTISHELGHYRQALVNSSLNEQPNLNIVALREAQAYAHQVVFFRTLESLTGLDLLLYPSCLGTRDS